MKSPGKRQWMVGTMMALSMGACGSPPPPAAPEEPVSLEPSEPAPAGKKAEGIELVKAEKYAEAEPVLAEARKDAPKDAEVAYYHGVTLERLERFDDAKAAYEAALKLKPGFPEAALNYSALLLEVSGDATRALEVAEQGLKADGANVALLANASVARQTLADAASGDGAKVLYVAAADGFAKVGAQAKGDEQLGWGLREIECRWKAGDEKGARTRSEVLTANGNALALQAMGDLFGKLGAFDDCLTMLDRSWKVTPEATTAVRQGKCYHGLKKETEAQSAFRRALTVGKDPAVHAAARFYLAVSLWADKPKRKANKAEVQKLLEQAKVDGAGTPVEAPATKLLAEVTGK